MRAHFVRYGVWLQQTRKVPHADMDGEITWSKSSVVRGHHVYKAIWTPYVGQRLQLSCEDSNDHDEHAVAVRKTAGGARAVVGHVPVKCLAHYGTS